MMRFVCALMMLAGLLLATPSMAVMPDEVLTDARLEERARVISRDLRCMVCQNQSIDDSDAPLAKDLRVIVRERLLAGDSNDEVIDFVVARYGEFVLLRPRISAHTLALWASPLLLVLAGIGIIALRRKGAPRAETAALTADEEARIAMLLRAEDHKR